MVLTPLSTIFQLYHGCSWKCLMNLSYRMYERMKNHQEKTTKLSITSSKKNVLN